MEVSAARGRRLDEPEGGWDGTLRAQAVHTQCRPSVMLFGRCSSRNPWHLPCLHLTACRAENTLSVARSPIQEGEAVGVVVRPLAPAGSPGTCLHSTACTVRKSTCPNTLQIAHQMWVPRRTTSCNVNAHCMTALCRRTVLSHHCILQSSLTACPSHALCKSCGG